MEFNVSTFALEIVNFLILLWILQRLFYQPLLNIIAQRKQLITESLQSAQSLQAQAVQEREALQQQLRQLEQQKQAAYDALQQEIEHERQARRTQLQAEFDSERQKLSLALNRELQEQQRQLEQQAVANGAQFASLLLQQAVTPELEHKLCTLVLQRLQTLPSSAHATKALNVKITSAFPLPAALQQQLQQHLRTLIPGTIECQFQQNPALLAGIQIDLGHWVLDANLQHELAGFATLAVLTHAD